MTDQVRRRNLGDALETALANQAGAERYQRYQQRTRRGRVDGPRPMEFDESGFPLPQRNPGFVERVTRLLNPL
jgi:hypothetical protein